MYVCMYVRRKMQFIHENDKDTCVYACVSFYAYVLQARAAAVAVSINCVAVEVL